MTNIDKAREIARGWLKASETGVYSTDVGDAMLDIKALAAGFLALDELLETHLPTEKPERDVGVLITFKKGHTLMGWWEHGNSWCCDFLHIDGERLTGIVCASSDIKHWQHLTTADKK